MREDDKQTGGRPDEHIEEAVLIDYQLGRLGGVDRDLVQYHLLACDDCVATFRNIQDFFEPPLRGEGVDEGAPEAQWASLWKRLEAEGDAGGATAGRYGGWLRGRLPVAAAAVLLVALTLTSIWAFGLRRERQRLVARLQELSAVPGREHKGAEGDRPLIERVKELEREKLDLQEKLRASGENDKSHVPTPKRPPAEPPRSPRPELNLPIFDLYPRDSVQRSGGPGDDGVVRVPARAKGFILILNGQGQAPYGDYRVELYNEKGRVLWGGTGLRRDDFGNFVISLDRGFLGRGFYRLNLYGLDAKNSRQIAEYSLRVE